jgi:hypothetical protein
MKAYGGMMSLHYVSALKLFLRLNSWIKFCKFIRLARVQK